MQAVLVEHAEYSYVVNIFGQLNYGRQDVLYTDYEALKQGLVKLKDSAKELGLSVAFTVQHWLRSC